MSTAIESAAGSPREAGQPDEARARRVLIAVAQSVVSRADELTALDSAIGDGDHGFNMKRGFEAVLADADKLSAMPLPEALKAIGMKLVTTVGGASGPLFGTFFLTLGKQLTEAPSREEVVSAFEAAIAATRARGKSEPGQKTVLDVLIPTQRALAEGADLAGVKRTAIEAAEATASMRATRGRASFLGERSVGHIDPGAKSAALMIGAFCDAFGVP